MLDAFVAIGLSDFSQVGFIKSGASEAPLTDFLWREHRDQPEDISVDRAEKLGFVWVLQGVDYVRVPAT